MKIKTFILLLFTICGYSQDNRKLTLRGKVLASLLLEDDNTYTGTIGLEYEFIKNHSIGGDVIYYENQKEYDTAEDENTGIYETTKSLSYLADYRYYIQPAIAKDLGQKIYISLYYKYISKDYNNDPEVKLSNNSRKKGNYYYNDIGTALGYRISFNPDDENFGLDMNLGVSYRFKNEDYVLYIDENSPTQYIENEKSNKWLPSIRLNLYYKFW